MRGLATLLEGAGLAFDKQKYRLETIQISDLAHLNGW